MLKFYKILFVNVFVFIFSTNLLVASSLQESESFLYKFVENTLIILNDEDIPSDQRTKLLVEFVTPVVDGELVSKSTIGSKKWKKLSDEERENFLVALKNYLSKRVSVYVTNYVATDINFKIIKNEFVGKNDKYIKVYSTVSGSGTDTIGFKINWFLSQNNDLKIFNIEVDDGVHLLKILKDQIQAVLNKHDGDINLLIADLAELD
tara:strand:- start:129 stop:746 length:618 start_codon:yes stop_codon:yes gene_type:complete